MKDQLPLVIFWFRRDLRLTDNVGLYEALTGEHKVLPLFIFDSEILEKLDQNTDIRISFITEALQRLNKALNERGTSLLVLYGKPLDVFRSLMERYDLKGVYTNEDYEPDAIMRDKAVSELLKTRGIPFFSFNDHVIFAKESLMTGSGKPYTVFTPYSRKWKEKLQANDYKSYPSESVNDNWMPQEAGAIPDPKMLGFEIFQSVFKEPTLDCKVVTAYDEARNIPAIEGTTQIGPHLRFGTISIRECVRFALEKNMIWLNQLIWRDFFIQILWNFPGAVHRSFQEKFDRVKWLNDEQDFERWKNGTTGIPIVDAGMRQLNQTGYMHNRVRMIVASFLTKHLLIDWRWGEAYFASRLLDYELASNNGNWQWAAGTGVDPSPWFRIFNPLLQSQKFDPTNEYVKRWVPEFGSPGYVSPMIDLKFGRKRCLDTYKRAIRDEGFGVSPHFLR